MNIRMHNSGMKWLQSAMMSLVMSFIASPGFAQSKPQQAGADARPSIQVAKTATCGCCHAWIKHLQNAGFGVSAKNMSSGTLSALKKENGILPKFASCHTAKVGGYVIEGHVPAEDILRLLREKPDAVGLSVPGMPIGSPGMEGGRPEVYEVVLFGRDRPQSYGRYLGDRPA